MKYFKHILIIIGFGIVIFLKPASVSAQDLPIRYATLELFTNTPCPICASQNPGLFNRLANYEGQYHLIGFYPGSPYSSCIFYQANIPQNSARVQHYSGEIFGSPTVALNGIDFKSSSGVNTTVLDNLTGGTSWLYINVDETTGTSRSVTIDLQDVVGGSLTTGRLYAVIVEKEISYNAPNGETLHHNVFRRFLTDVNGEDVDLTSGQATKTYQYAVSGTWNADETYVIAWLMDPTTEEIY
ncbi:MAG TPA: Omp28-related outer membrane protein, partial [Saprospiraceae bacterium]|nr:Omp28-related outer membrane protein [Saprospiraceae bacterium]